MGALGNGSAQPFATFPLLARLVAPLCFPQPFSSLDVSLRRPIVDAGFSSSPTNWSYGPAVSASGHHVGGGGCPSELAAHHQRLPAGPEPHRRAPRAAFLAAVNFSRPSLPRPVDSPLLYRPAFRHSGQRPDRAVRGRVHQNRLINYVLANARTSAPTASRCCSFLILATLRTTLSNIRS